ncbi:uroporphyrinogen-III C-methyltransferase [Vibrio sp. S4M6]|uniref:uroporphyrinogen-III C-methyltransferase n=1 Tax=Vibrio sinus TaxID=2946865 RepID=UPI00202ABB9A|nr:uroporphyrinogen-III C-methyltransferase [Vibrio sinus]MCL9782541.1 uroporphyrinogen-III C-methyltransferase [Vibrio sinus]
MTEMSKLSNQTKLGMVYLVGAGPGDPELLTIKAANAIQQSDVIVYDHLVSKEIRNTFPVHSRAIYVGKAKGKHSYSQEDINHLMAEFTVAGQTVCRVKGGDAFVFGRGGEEMIHLSEQGITVQVIPGITAASGCTAYAGIPLTHRGLAQGCTFITAHAQDKLDIQWTSLANLNQTLVIYMGLSKTQLITKQLISAGLDRNTPAALIENGCTPEQRNVVGKLHQLTQLKDTYHIQSPAIIVIGKVVSIYKESHTIDRPSTSPLTSLDNQFAPIINLPPVSPLSKSA